MVNLIKPLTKTWAPTPSALAFQQANLDVDENGVDLMALNFISTWEYGETHDGPDWSLGRVLSDAEVNLRRMQRDPAMSGTQELHRLWLVVQQEYAEASGIY